MCPLGQHEQKKYLSDANNHSTDKDTLLWNQLHALGLVLIHLFLAVLLVTPPLVLQTTNGEVRMWLRYALHKSSWGIISHKSL